MSNRERPDLTDVFADALIVLSPDGAIHHWNSGAETMFGYSRQAVIGTSIAELLIPPELVDEFWQQVRNTMTQGASTYESVRRHKEGTMVHVEVSMKAIQRTEVAPALIAVSEKDVTELKYRREAEVLDAKYRGLMEASPDALVIANQDGRIVLLNSQTETLFGYARHELLGKPIEVLVPECFRKEHPGRRERYQGDSRKRPMGIGLDLYARRKDGAEFPAEISLSPLETDTGRLTMAAIRDVTERKKVEARFRGLLEAAPDAMIVVAQTGLIVLVNSRAEQLFGYTRQEMLGKPIEILVPKGAHGHHPGHRQGYFGAPHPRPMGAGELNAVRKDGSEFPAEISLSPLETEDGTLVTAAVRDITERKRQEELRLKADALFNKTFHANPSPALIISLGEWRVVEINPSFLQILGGLREQMIGRTTGELGFWNTPAQREAVLQMLKEQGAIQDLEVTVPDSAGAIRHLLVSAQPVELDGLPCLLSMFIDISDRVALASELEYQAFHDPLTRLGNRAMLAKRLRRALGPSHSPRRQDGVVAVLFLDLDNFKDINDSMGHELGDQLLVQVAERIRAQVRECDFIARLGGDEFTVLLEEKVIPEAASNVAERLVTTMRQPFSLGGLEVFVTCSIGVALASDDAKEPADLLREADLALYQAKHHGKSAFAVFHPSMDAGARERRQLVSDLRSAVEQGELRAYFQPIVELRSGRVIGFESLLRWDRPGVGIVAPGEFIGLAEEHGLAVPIGAWILQESCRQIRAWQKRYPADPPLFVNVNISARQFQDPSLVAQVAAVLRSTGVHPSTLRLEITESVAMQDMESAVGALEALKVSGVQLAIDDFGTGYSSLAYLKRLPIDTLKIDRSFVAGLGTSREDTALVKMILALGKMMNLRVTAEGIETQQQWAELRSMGCPGGQGYYFSRPLPAAQLEPMLDRQWAPGVMRTGRVSYLPVGE